MVPSALATAQGYLRGCFRPSNRAASMRLPALALTDTPLPVSLYLYFSRFLLVSLYFWGLSDYGPASAVCLVALWLSLFSRVRTRFSLTWCLDAQPRTDPLPPCWRAWGHHLR